MRIGVIVRQDLTGLGVQTRAIARLLDADKLIVIDSSGFNGNEQHPELLNGLTNNRCDVYGFINLRTLDRILEGIDVLITCEIDYTPNYELTARARELGVKTVIVANFEFADWLQRPHLPRPDVIANHSDWRNSDLEYFLEKKVPVLRTPIFMEEYAEVFNYNVARTHQPRFLHIAGRKTHLDRNGTQSLIEAIRLVPQEVKFELVIKTQTVDVQSNDPRVIIDSSSPLDERELYKGFDAMILPRRYAGACLPMQESLAAGVPVIMTNIDPNNKILPKEWLIPSHQDTAFMARTLINVYSVDRKALALKIEDLAAMTADQVKKSRIKALTIADNYFSSKSVRRDWDVILESLEVDK